MEKSAHCFDGLELVIEVGLEVEFHGIRLQAADGFEAVLLEDGHQVGLGHVIGEGAVAEHDGALSYRGLFLVPRDHPKSHGIRLGLGDGFGEADQENAATDAVDRLTGNVALNDWHGEIQAELEEEFKENVLLGTVLF